MKRLILISFSLLISFIFGFSFSFAGPTDSVDKYVNPVGSNIATSEYGDLPTVTQSIVGTVANTAISRILGIIGIVVLCMFIFSGLQYILARGDSSKVRQANDTMKWSIIGLVIVFASFIIINFMFSVLGKLKTP